MGKFGRNLGAKSPFFYTQIRSSRSVRPTDSTGLSKLAIGSIPIARSITHDDSIVPTPLNQLNTATKLGVLIPRWSQRNKLVPTSQSEVGRRWTPAPGPLDARKL